MPGVIWNESELTALKKYVSQGLGARAMKGRGLFEPGGKEGGQVSRSVMSLQKQMQRLGIADPERSSMIKADKAAAWAGKDRNACISDLVSNWRTTPVEVFAKRWEVSPATIKYLLKQRGLGLSWKEAIRLKDSPFRDSAKRKEWAATFRANVERRRARRREDLIEASRQRLASEKGHSRRRCLECRNTFPLSNQFFRLTKHRGVEYFSHLCLVCSCERGEKRGADRENLMVRRNRERLEALRTRMGDAHQGLEERICWKCSRSWPLDRQFFKSTRSKSTGRTLFEHVCRLCRAARRRTLHRQNK